MIDYKKQDFEKVLHDYDAVLGTVRGDSIEKSLQILRPRSRIVSLVGPPDAGLCAGAKNGSVVQAHLQPPEPQNHSLSQEAWSRVFLPLRPPGRAAASRNRQAASGRSDPPRDRQGFPLRSSHRGTGPISNKAGQKAKSSCRWWADPCGVRVISCRPHFLNSLTPLLVTSLVTPAWSAHQRKGLMKPAVLRSAAGDSRGPA